MTSVFDQRPGPRRILSIDGGGIRGALAVGLIERIEATLREKLGKPDLVLSDYFDLIGGTSTGAIIATGLALGHTVESLIDLYCTLSERGFQKTGFFSMGGILAPKFKQEALTEVIAKYIKDKTLGSEDLLTGL